MIGELAERIWSHEQFHREAGELRRYALRTRYVPSSEATHDVEMLLRLLRSATVLAASPTRTHRELAFQIATAASEISSDSLVGTSYILLLVLSRLGNFPALNFAKQRFSISEDVLPVRMVAEASTRAESNSIRVRDASIALTDFQRELWDALITGDSIGVSAPTSAGKSYVLQTYARKLLNEQQVNGIAFLVPTRALINQVADEVSQWLRSDKIEAELVTTPIPKDSPLPARAAYVVTQERMQLLQAAHPGLAFGAILIDEAQSLADGPRGVLLSSVIEEALKRNPKTQLLFAGPNLRDPGSLSILFGKRARSVVTDEATVVQNIIFVDCDEERPKSAKIAFLAEKQRVLLGTIECDQPLTDHRSKLVNLALRLGGGGQNLIYALGPAECENIAFGLADNDSKAGPPELEDLSSFIKEAVHPKYQLAGNVLQKVGFHYGRLPSLVRKAIEDAFAQGHLQFLVTTSTLLYGVNLPAQNLFLHNPQKGKNQPISPIDFWNLAGRAGRLGKEFTGNVFLIDYGQWPNDPMSGDKDQTVLPSIQDHIAGRTDELISYVMDSKVIPDREKPDEMENTFVKLVRDHLEGNLGSTLDRAGLLDNNPKRTELIQAIETSVASTKIDRDTIIASPTVSIHRQQSLYERLDDGIRRKGPAYVIPKHPLDSGAYTSYLAAIKRCHDEIMKYPKGERSHVYYALLALRWMKGEPLPQIIDASFEYKRRRGSNPNIATVIRDSLNEIERDLRFKYVRLFSCYNAVLELVLRDRKMQELAASIPSIPMYLEVGACSPTMISFSGPRSIPLYCG